MSWRRRRIERVVIGADLNGHVGAGNRGDEEAMGRFGIQVTTYSPHDQLL